jgi:hypothetical protein
MRQRNKKQYRSKRQMPPPPAKTENNGSMSTSWLFNTIAQGFAFGTGSSVAHRIVDSVTSGSTSNSDLPNPSPITSTTNTNQSDTEKLNDTECYELINNYYGCIANYKQTDCGLVGRQLMRCLDQASNK